MATGIETNHGGTESYDKRFHQHVEKTDVLVDMAQLGTEQEHSLGTLEAVRIYRKGVMFCVLITLSIIMRMYDIGIINSFFALPAFRERYGSPVVGNPAVGKQIPAPWQVALGIASLVGQVIGATLVAWPMEWWGRRKALAICLCMTASLTFMQVFAPSIQVLTASEYLSGVVWGSYQVLIPTYSAELLPMVLRPYLAAYVSVNYSIGQLIIAGVTKGFDSWTTEWGYRIPFTLQWVWPIIVLPILWFTPESPWWLIRQDKLEEAAQSLRRLSSPDPKIDITRTLAMIQKTDLYERKIEEGTSIWDCFKGCSLRRTEIVIMIFFVQDFAQSPVSYTYFFQQLGLGTDQAFNMSLGMTSVGLVCCLSSAFLLRFYGRRSVFTLGIAMLSILQFIVGFLDLAPNYTENHGFAWGQFGVLIIASAFYHLTIGPITYSILTEVPSIKLRSKTVGVAIAIDAIFGIITLIIIPYLVSPAEANARGKTDFLWGGMSIISVLWCFFRLPETKHRTVEELDYMFENKVPTRAFKKYVIDEEVLRHDLEE
jgi:SP family general alpha glucoside:H+ symporter-like MFS transporter